MENKANSKESLIAKFGNNDLVRLIGGGFVAPVVMAFIGMAGLSYSHLSTYGGQFGREKMCEVARTESARSILRENYDSSRISQKVLYPFFNLFAQGIDTGSWLYDKTHCQ